MRFRNIYLYGIALLLFASVSILRSISFKKMNRFTALVDEGRETIAELEKLATSFKSAQIYSPSYEKQIAARFYFQLRIESEKIPGRLARIDTLLQDRQSRVLFDSVATLVRRNLPSMMKWNIVEMINAGEGWRLGEVYTVEMLINEIVVRQEAQLLMKRRELEKSTQDTDRVSTVLTTVASIIILIAFFSNYRLFSRRMWLEDFLQSILKSSQYGVISYKAIRTKQGKVKDFLIEYANPVIEELVNRKPSDLIGRRMTEYNTFFNDYFDAFVSVVNNDEKQTFELKTKTKWLYLLLAKNGERVTACFQDITSLKNYQSDLETTVQKLEATNAELEQYAYAASHDLQEPLRKINIFTSLLMDRRSEHLDEQDNVFLTKIINATKRMTTLVTDLLSFSSLRKGHDYAPTDLNESLRAVLEDLDLLIQQKQAIIHHETLPVIDAIPLQMQQIFYNLLNNALKFSRKDVRPEVFITSRLLTPEELQSNSRLDPAKQYVELCFRDNGIGFNNTYADQIFGLFKRLHSKDVYKGSGIGLALCQRVAENHHGYMYARGVPEQGASFFVILLVNQDLPAVA